MANIRQITNLRFISRIFSQSLSISENKVNRRKIKDLNQPSQNFDCAENQLPENSGSTRRDGNNMKMKIEPGSRFGNLTVLSKSDERKNGYIVWNCQCDCGNCIQLDSRTLQRGTHTDCGCHDHLPPRVKDLRGKKFGQLTVLRPAGGMDKNGSFLWECECECGNHINASTKQLTSGTRKSCGCLSHPPLKDWIGKRFHSLTVIAYAGKENGMHRWLCRCDCGNEKIVGQTLLQNGKTKSCGCLQKAIFKENLQLVDGTSVTILEKRKGQTGIRNTSGITGVYKNHRSGKWVAQITFRSKTHYLGSYPTLEEAAQARKKAEEDYFDAFLEEYHSSHPSAPMASEKAHAA